MILQKRICYFVFDGKTPFDSWKWIWNYASFFQIKIYFSEKQTTIDELAKEDFKALAKGIESISKVIQKRLCCLEKKLFQYLILI
jgi:hypothetical protein